LTEEHPAAAPCTRPRPRGPRGGLSIRVLPGHAPWPCCNPTSRSWPEKFTGLRFHARRLRHPPGEWIRIYLIC